jgi:hypothetical protein
MSLFLNGATDDLSTSINLGTPKVNAAGGKNIPIFNKIARNGLKVETPMMLTWGINENQFDGSDKKSYDMSLQFPSAEYLREDTSAFLENMKKMNDYIKDQACINSKAWFGKVQSAEVVDAFWTPLLKYPKDKSTGEPDHSKSPTLRVKIPFWDGQFKCEIYNVQRELIFPKPGVSILDVVPKGSEVKMYKEDRGKALAWPGDLGKHHALIEEMIKLGVVSLHQDETTRSYAQIHPAALKRAVDKYCTLDTTLAGGTAEAAPVSAPTAPVSGAVTGGSSSSNAKSAALQAAAAAAQQAPFLAADAFAGPRAGYVFKRGEHGVGYYADGVLAATAAALAVSASSLLARSNSPRCCQSARSAAKAAWRWPSKAVIDSAFSRRKAR